MSKKNTTSTNPAKKPAKKQPKKQEQPKPDAAPVPGAQADTDLVPLTELDKQKKPKEPKKERGMSGLDAAAHVLKEAGEPLKVSQIVGTALAAGYWKTDGKTPAATIYTAWTMLAKAG